MANIAMRPKRRIHAQAPSRWFNPPPKAPKPEINQKQLAEWVKFCRGEPSAWKRGHPTVAERIARQERIASMFGL